MLGFDKDIFHNSILTVSIVVYMNQKYN